MALGAYFLSFAPCLQQLLKNNPPRMPASLRAREKMDRKWRNLKKSLSSVRAAVYLLRRQLLQMVCAFFNSGFPISNGIFQSARAAQVGFSAAANKFCAIPIKVLVAEAQIISPTGMLPFNWLRVKINSLGRSISSRMRF